MRNKGNNGITIIILVITIIILLLLVGVSISVLTGKNGLIEKTKQSKRTYIETEIKESLILAISDLQAQKNGKATIEDITQEWLNSSLNVYNSNIKSDESTNAKIITMQKDNIIKSYKINGNLSIEEIENERISLIYEVGQRTGKNINILIKIVAQDGIKEIHTPELDVIYVYGKKEIAIDYTVELDVEYKFKIISELGEEKEEIIHIQPQIEITTIYINETQNATKSLPEYSVEKGTPLYISFDATLEGQVCSIEPPLTQAITKNGKYTYIITGTYNGRTITTTKEIFVKQYMAARDLVQYDAGEWTKEEIEELTNKKLYDINVDKKRSNEYKINSETGLNLTFGGFTYKGDNENEENINEKKIITSRNQSVVNEDGVSPKYEGWQVMESKEENGRIYVTKLIHAGSPETFVAYSYGASFGNDFGNMRKICFIYYLRWKGGDKVFFIKRWNKSKC